MADISIQFYALPNELLMLTCEAVAEFNLHVVAMRYPPFAAVEIKSEQLEEVFTGYSRVREVAFTLCPPELPADGRLEFIDKNPDQLDLQIGRQTENGLEESWLSARTENTEALAVWKRIANKLKKRTKAGITAINRQSGASAFYKSARYTEGAKALEASGVEMLPLGGPGPKGPRIVLGMGDAAP